MGFIKPKNNNNIVISKKPENNNNNNNNIENKEHKNKHKSYESIRKLVTEDSNIIEKETKNKNNSIKKDSISIGL
jgi:hypothetical protein